MPISPRFALRLLTLMAMGNWVNTPSPELDSDAPPSKGNDGELVLDGTTYPVQSARLSGTSLLLLGESVSGQPLFTLSTTLPAKALDEGALKPQTLRGMSLKIGSGGVLATKTISGGTIKVSSATGNGPWEIDGDVELSSGEGETHSGVLRARIRA